MAFSPMTKGAMAIAGLLGASAMAIAPAYAESLIGESQLQTEASTSVAQINDPQIDGGQIDDGQIDDGQINDPQIDDGQLDDGQLDDGQLDDGQINDGQVDDGQMNAPQINDPQIDDEQIDDGQIDDGQIDDGQVDDPQMNNPMNNQTSSMTITELASSNNNFSTLQRALEAANLGSTLSGTGPYTVFAPTDAAFNQLPDGALEFLLQPENQDLLRQVLTYHVVPGEIMANELTTGSVDALGGGLAVGVYDSGVVINNASVIQPNIQASNGVVHAVNRVLIPETLQQQLAERLGVNDIY